MPESVTRYLQRAGLAPTDVPKVLATFAAAKYCTLCSFVLVGSHDVIRYSSMVTVLRVAVLVALTRRAITSY